MVQIDMHLVRDASVSDVGRRDSEVNDAQVSDMQSTDAMIALDASTDYPLDDMLRINHIQCKGTHNSYHVAPESSEIIMEWAYTHAPLDEQLEAYGVRQIELDIHYTPEGEFEVFHIPFVDQGSTCDLLEDSPKL